MRNEMTYQVRFKDIDPDSGTVSQDEFFCMCQEENTAKLILSFVIKDWYSENGPSDSNREFYILKNL